MRGQLLPYIYFIQKKLEEQASCETKHISESNTRVENQNIQKSSGTELPKIHNAAKYSNITLGETSFKDFYEQLNIEAGDPDDPENPYSNIFNKLEKVVFKQKITKVEPNTLYIGCTAYIDPPKTKKEIINLENCVFFKCSFRQALEANSVKDCLFVDSNFSDISVQKQPTNLIFHRGFGEKLSFDDADNNNLRNIQGLKSLKHLNVSFGSIDSQGLEYLKDFKQLQNLSLQQCTDDKKIFASIGSLFPNLLSLNLAGNYALAQNEVRQLVGPEGNFTGIKELRKLKKLKSLNLSDCGVNDYGMKYLTSDLFGLSKPFKNLESLTLSSNRISDSGLVYLKNLTKLKKLDLYKQSAFFTSKGLEQLAKDAPNLTHLKFSCREPGPYSGGYRFGIPERRLEHLGKFPNLKHLELPDAKITSLGLKHISQLSKLQTLNLKHSFMSRIQPDDLQYIGKLKNLRSLTIGGYGCLSEKDCLHHLSELSKLQYLDLHDTAASNNDIKSLAKLTKLRSLDLSETLVSLSGLQALKELKDLETLRIYGTSRRIKSEDIPKIRRIFPRLKSF